MKANPLKGYVEWCELVICMKRFHILNYTIKIMF